MRVRALIAVFLCGCSFDSSVDVFDGFIDANPASPDAPLRDASLADAVVDADPGCTSVGILGFVATNIDPCILPPAAPGNTTINDATPLNTDDYSADNSLTIPQLDDAGQEVLVLRYENLTIERWLITGPKPVVIVADNITITGRFEVRSNRRGDASPGADLDCGAGLGNDGDLQPGSTGYRGASGGGYAGRGGKGGEAEGGGSQKIPEGQANGATEISPLRGGCSGGDGGRADSGIIDLLTSLASVRGGSGGGGVQLIASGTITVTATGVVAAPGRSGGTYFVQGIGGLARSGGSGAGSGGAIFLEAATIDIAKDARVAALGGGGGEGRDNGTVSGSPSSAGQGAYPIGNVVPAEGGETDGQDGGDGGKGSDKNLGSDGEDGKAGKDLGSDERSGGGGGGGGVGRVRLRVIGGTLTNDGTVEPPAREDVQ